MRKKIFSLLMPYVLWSVIGSCCLAPLVMVANSLSGRPILHATFISSSSVWQFFDRLLGIVSFAPSNYGVLWYVRNLLLLFALAPVWRLFQHKRVAWMLAIIALSLQLFPCNFISHPKHTLWFFVGMIAAVYLNVEPIKKEGADGKSVSLLDCSFWLYCSHVIILEYVRSICHYLLPTCNMTIVITTAMCFIVTITLSIFLGFALRKSLPLVARTLSGGRM